MHSPLQGQDGRGDLGQGGKQCLLPPKVLCLPTAWGFQGVGLVHTNPHTTGPWAWLELPDTTISCIRRDATSTPSLPPASVMFWQVTEEAGGGGKVRKTLWNFPSTSETGTQQHKTTADQFPVHLGCTSQAGNTLTTRWKVACLKQAEAHGANHKLETSPVLFSPESPVPKKSAVCWLRALSVPLAHSGLKGSTSVIRLRASNNSCVCSLN